MNLLGFPLSRVPRKKHLDLSRYAGEDWSEGPLPGSRRKASPPMAAGNGSSGIAVVGSGVAGLHLALLPQQEGIPVTLYSDQTAAQLACGRMLNTVAHHNTTVKREQALGVDHWDLQKYGYFCHHHYIGGARPRALPPAFRAPPPARAYP